MNYVHPIHEFNFITLGSACHGPNHNNRRKDYETGDSIHGYGSDLDFLQMNDKKRLQKAKSYRGLRYHARLPVRGQRTKSNFRRGKSLGVAKKGKK